MMRNNKKSSVRPFLLRNCASTSCARPVRLMYSILFLHDGQEEMLLKAGFR